jgi:hypothetical protein
MNDERSVDQPPYMQVFKNGTTFTQPRWIYISAKRGYWLLRSETEGVSILNDISDKQMKEDYSLCLFLFIVSGEFHL